jgi:hypothetical protein
MTVDRHLVTILSAANQRVQTTSRLVKCSHLQQQFPIQVSRDVYIHRKIDQAYRNTKLCLRKITFQTCSNAESSIIQITGILPHENIDHESGRS